jgi:uncharacterized protein (TIGR03382 family)
VPPYGSDQFICPSGPASSPTAPTYSQGTASENSTASAEAHGGSCSAGPVGVAGGASWLVAALGLALLVRRRG